MTVADDKQTKINLSKLWFMRQEVVPLRAQEKTAFVS